MGDIDGDGKPDMVVVHYAAGSISVLRNISHKGSLGASSFAPPVDFAIAGAAYGIAIEDLDGDGKLDIAVPNYNIGSISILRNTSTTGVIDGSSLASRVDV